MTKNNTRSTSRGLSPDVAEALNELLNNVQVSAGNPDFDKQVSLVRRARKELKVYLPSTKLKDA